MVLGAYLINTSYKELLAPLPVSLLCKNMENGEVYANPACLSMFGAERQADTFGNSLVFYDVQSRQPLTAEQHPFSLCNGQDTLHLEARVKSNFKNLNCRIEGKKVTFDGQPWVVLHVHSLQDNDITGTQTTYSSMANHLAFSRLLSGISSQLINVKTEHLDELIERSLGAFGEFCGVDRCYLFQFSDDKTSMNNTHEWVAPGVLPYKDDLQNVSSNDLPYFDNTIKTKNVFKIDNVDDLPDEAALEKEEFKRERIKSVLCVAVHINDKLFGFIGCDIIGSPYSWREHDVRYLKLIGEMLSNTLESVTNRVSLQQVTTALEKANEQLAHQANFDGLTGIANRRQFDKSLEKALKRGTRDGKYISLLMVDVDHFKHFNDSFGHSAGDEALQKVAETLESCCKRTDDLAARYGGEEFCMILPNTNQEESLSVAQEVMRAMAALNISFEPSLGEGILSVSIGKATLKCDASITNAQLIDLADKALYRAKKDGRNCIASA